MWQEELAARVRSTAWDRVAALFGVQLPVATASRLTALARLARDEWDFRRGAERSGVGGLGPSFGQTADAVVVTAAAELGMVRSTRARTGWYDGVIVPGGAGRAPLQRLAYALEQRVECAWVAMLGSDRAVDDDERSRSGVRAPSVRTEFDLMTAAVETLTGRSSFSELSAVASGYDRAPGTAVRLRHYTGRSGPASAAPVWCLSAPTPAGRSRAATEHTFELLRDASPQPLRPDSRLLVVTNALYAPYQGMHAQRVLGVPTGASVDVIGFSANHYGRKVRLSPFLLLQEMKSYVDSMCRSVFGTTPTGLAA